MEAIDQRKLSEEIASARNSIDSTLALIKTQLTTLNAKITTALGDLEAEGMHAHLKFLGNLHDQGASIDSQVRRLNEQKAHFKQILMHISMIRDA